MSGAEYRARLTVARAALGRYDAERQAAEHEGRAVDWLALAVGTRDALAGLVAVLDGDQAAAPEPAEAAR
jgi:hypothetical protein